MAAQLLGGGVQGIYEEIKGAGGGKAGGEDEPNAIEPKEYFWDQFLKYISSAILALTVLNVSVEFLRGGGVVCFSPPDSRYLIHAEPGEREYEFSRSHADYVNNYCSRSVPVTEYFPIYILVHGLLLIAPHYVWGAMFKGDFDSFFAIVGRFDRLRDNRTGEYDARNFDRVQKLELEYGGKNRTIFYCYVVKLFLQVLVCMGSIIFSQKFFIDFSFSFNCPDDFAIEGDVPPNWPLNTSVPCVFTSLRLLSLVRYADYILLVAAALLIVWGLMWSLVRHTAQLGYVEVAKFAFQSCLTPDSFTFPHVLSWPAYPCKTNRRCCRFRYPYISLYNLVSPRIRNDLDFLLMRLFRADASHGKVFKDIQVNKELTSLLGRDHQLLHLYINVQQDMAQAGEIPEDEEEENRGEENREEEDRQGDGDTGCCGCLRRMFHRVRHLWTQSANQDDSLPTHREGGNQPGPVIRGGRGRGTGEGTGQLVSFPGHEDSVLDEEDASCSCCGRLRQMCQHAFSSCRAEPKRPLLRRQNTQYDRIADFKDYFRDAGFKTNPERHAYHYFKPYLGNTEWHPVEGIRDRIYGFVQFCPKVVDVRTGKRRPKTDMAMDLSFGSVGYALVLARPFKVVVSVNFHPFYRNDKEVAKRDEFYTNYVTVKFPSDIFTQKNSSINKASEQVFNFITGTKFKIDFLVVGPFSEEAKKVSVNLMINLLYTAKVIEEGAVLLAIRPLRVGHKKVTQRFFKYEPPKQLFDHHDVTERLEKEVGIKWVDGFAGIRVLCGNIPCVFEFVTYKYKVAQDRPPNNDHVQTTDTSSGMPVEEPDYGGATAQPNNGSDSPGVLTENGTLASPRNLSQQDINRIKEKIQGMPGPPAPIMVERRHPQEQPQGSQQHGTRSPTRFVPADFKSDQPRALHFPSCSSSSATSTTTTTSNDFPPTDVTETTPMATPEYQVRTAARASISSTGEILLNGSDSHLSDDQAPNNDVASLLSDQSQALRSKPKPKTPVVECDPLSPANTFSGINFDPILSAQNHMPSGGVPQHTHKKPDKNSPATLPGALSPAAPHHRYNRGSGYNGGSGFRSQMSLDAGAILEWLPVGGGRSKNVSNGYNNDASALVAVNGHVVDNEVPAATPEGGPGHSTEV